MATGHAAVELTRQCLADGEEAGAIIEQRLVPGMAVVGERFQCDEIFVPEMLISANAMKASLAILEPLIAESGAKPPHTAIIGTVQGDLHDIGKNLVGMMWRGANFAVVDLGVNVSPAAFASAAQEHQPDIVGMSALPDHDDAAHARGGARGEGHRRQHQDRHRRRAGHRGVRPRGRGGRLRSRCRRRGRRGAGAHRGGVASRTGVTP